MHLIASVTLGGFLILASILHVAAPARVQTLVPQWWPAPRATVYLSGLVELLLGIGLFFDATRVTAGVLTAVLFAGYVGVHADDLRHVRTASRWFDSLPGVLLRVLANVAYVGWALYAGLGG